MSETKPGLSNEAFIEKRRKYLRGDRDDTGEQIIYNLRVLPEALDRLEALIGQGKPTPGQIGGEEALKFQDAQTLAAYWVMSDSENRRKMWESDIKKICEALLSVSRQGQEERDYTPEEAQLEVTKRFGQGSSVQVDFEVNSDWTWTKRVTLFDWESNEISEAETFREAFAAADAAKKEGGK